MKKIFLMMLSVVFFTSVNAMNNSGSGSESVTNNSASTSDGRTSGVGASDTMNPSGETGVNTMGSGANGAGTAGTILK